MYNEVRRDDDHLDDQEYHYPPWHVDTNHKLIRWRLVIVGGIDGFSRMIMYLNCTDNNKAQTIFKCFLTGVKDYGLPIHLERYKPVAAIVPFFFHLSQTRQDDAYSLVIAIFALQVVSAVVVSALRCYVREEQVVVA
jgi:hypothetical protein